MNRFRSWCIKKNRFGSWCIKKNRFRSWCIKKNRFRSWCIKMNRLIKYRTIMYGSFGCHRQLVRFLTKGVSHGVKKSAPPPGTPHDNRCFLTKQIFTKGVGSLYKFNIEYRRTVRYRTVQYGTCTVPYGTIRAIRRLYGTCTVRHRTV